MTRTIQAYLSVGGSAIRASAHSIPLVDISIFAHTIMIGKVAISHAVASKASIDIACLTLLRTTKNVNRSRFFKVILTRTVILYSVYPVDTRFA